MADQPFEVIRLAIRRPDYRAVLFDFDGTLSLIREGWPAIMVGMMVDELRLHGAKDADADLWRLVEDFVMALNGRPAIFQMARLVEEINTRGGNPESATHYLQRYDDRLLKVVAERSREITQGQVPHTRWSVPGSHEILSRLRERGMNLYLASGTDIRFVRTEADLLEVSPFFGSEIHAPNGDDAAFSKRGVIERILARHNIRGEQLLSFGDGVIETAEVRRVGGAAVAVACDEHEGGVNEWKRNRLIPAGADIVIPDYRDHNALLNWLIVDR